MERITIKGQSSGQIVLAIIAAFQRFIQVSIAVASWNRGSSDARREHSSFRPRRVVQPNTPSRQTRCSRRRTTYGSMPSTTLAMTSSRLSWSANDRGSRLRWSHFRLRLVLPGVCACVLSTAVHLLRLRLCCFGCCSHDYLVVARFVSLMFAFYTT